MQRIVTAAVLAAMLKGSAVPSPEKLAIVGATLIDVSNYGHSTNDIANAVVLIEGGKITAAGQASAVAVPSDATRIDAAGKFVIPGLIDGFGALRTQGFADAYLYAGVTTVYVPMLLSAQGGDGELKILRTAEPSPRLFLGAAMTGYPQTNTDPAAYAAVKEERLHGTRLADDQLRARIDRLADEAFRGITIGSDVWPDQVDTILAEAKRRGIATIGQLGLTSYPYAIRAGIDALVRNDQYQIELAPALAKLERADDLRAGRAAGHVLCVIDPASNEVKNYAEQLSNAHTALMPALALEATANSLGVPNPWSARSAALIKPSDLDVPVDRATGASGWLASLPPDRREPVRQCALHKEATDAQLYKGGAKFLAGSDAATYGIMPGSGLQLELSLLHRIGLSAREAIAAATSNFADVYGWRDVGRIEPGRDADVLILDADPRADVSAVEHIDTLVFKGAVVNLDHLVPPGTSS